MSVRALEFLDLPTLYRYRSDVIPLDSTRQLTRGDPLGAVGFLAYLNPSRHIYTAIASENGVTLLGGIIHTRGEMYARLLYLAPAEDLGNPIAPSLVENLSAEAGKWNAHHVIAEVDERTCAFRALRLSGFSVYAWQRIWDVSALIASRESRGEWRRVKTTDLPAIQSLHHQIVPTLLHPIEQPPKRAVGLTCCSEALRGYVTVTYGMYGIVMTPLIHPEVYEAGEKLVSLFNHIPVQKGRHVYLCVRSYQAWLEPVLEDLGGQAGVRQAVMVKHLTAAIKDMQAVPGVQHSAVSVQPSRVSHLDSKPKS
jgi:hypothetical protein